MFTITKAQVHVSAINVGYLQVVHEELINKLYQRVWGVYSLWGAVGARSRFVLEKRVWSSPLHTLFSNTKRDLAPTAPHKL